MVVDKKFLERPPPRGLSFYGYHSAGYSLLAFGGQSGRAYGSSETIFMNSSRVHARAVLLRTLPVDPCASPNLAM
jgi:hypothetical protein